MALGTDLPNPGPTQSGPRPFEIAAGAALLGALLLVAWWMRR